MLGFTLRMIKTARGLERGVLMTEITNGLRLISVKLRGYEQSLLKVKKKKKPVISGINYHNLKNENHNLEKKISTNLPRSQQTILMEFTFAAKLVRYTSLRFCIIE